MSAMLNAYINVFLYYVVLELTNISMTSYPTVIQSSGGAPEIDTE